MRVKNKLQFTILDFGETDNKEENLLDVVKYAIASEELGFSRYWIGEHYITGTLFSNPEPLIPALAMATNTISIGVAGMLIRKHSVGKIAYSFGLMENLFKKRIDLGVVCPSSLAHLNSDSSYDTRSTKAIFEELTNYYKNVDDLNINSVLSPQLWHLTTSMRSYLLSTHSNQVNVAKSLFHWNSNFDNELDEIMQIKNLWDQRDHDCKISIAVGVFVSKDPSRIIAYRKFYKAALVENVFKFSVIESPDLFFERITEIAFHYQTEDIVILNLGRSYEDKNECISNISKIFNLKKCTEHSAEL